MSVSVFGPLQEPRILDVRLLKPGVPSSSVCPGGLLPALEDSKRRHLGRVFPCTFVEASQGSIRVSGGGSRAQFLRVS